MGICGCGWVIVKMIAEIGRDNNEEKWDINS